MCWLLVLCCGGGGLRKEMAVGLSAALFGNGRKTMRFVRQGKAFLGGCLCVLIRDALAQFPGP